jgi:hypothetical protein
LSGMTISSTVAFGFFFALGIMGEPLQCTLHCGYVLSTTPGLRFPNLTHARAAKRKVSAECGDSSLMEPDRKQPTSLLSSLRFSLRPFSSSA